jgi:hypothetical protein
MQQKMATAIPPPEREIWQWPVHVHRHTRTHPSLARAPVRAEPSDGRIAPLAAASSALFAQFCVLLVLWAAPWVILMRSDPHAISYALLRGSLHRDPGTALVLAFALVYVISTALLIAAAARQLAQARPRYVKACLFLIIMPPVLLSLAATPILSLGFFLSAAIWCFPALL